MNESTHTSNNPVVAKTLELIRTFPVYNSDGQRQVLDILEAQMKSLGGNTRRQAIVHEEIDNHNCYIPVENFGKKFKNYRSINSDVLLVEFDFGAAHPCVLLNGHVDVEFVTAKKRWTHKDGWCRGILEHDRIYGRGASDMLGAVASFGVVIERLLRQRSRLHGRLLLHLVVDEELGGNGTLQALTTLEEDRDEVDVAIIGEPTNGAVCTSSRSFEQFRVVCKGEPRHMCMSRAEDNAVYRIARVIEAIERVNAWCGLQCGQPDEGRWLCAGTVQAGTDAAVPAAAGEVIVTAALPPHLRLAEVRKQLKAELRAEGDRVGEVEIKLRGITFPASDGESNDMADRLRKHLVAAGGDAGRAAAAEFPSACDARIFEWFGIPTVIYGPGDLARAHGSDEFVKVGELETYVDVLTGALLETLLAPVD